MNPEFFAGAWSLAIEEWFYLLFPLAILVFARLLKKREAALLCAIVFFLVAPAVLRFFLPTNVNWDAGVRRITLPRLDAIGYGVLLAFAKNYYASAWKFLARLWPLGVLGVLGLYFQYSHHFLAHETFASNSIFDRVFYFCLFPLSLMLAFPRLAEMAEHAGWWWKVPVQKLSLWSYSIYLSHPPVIALVDAVLKHFGVSYLQAHIDRCILVWLICIPVSALTYKFYEKPFMSLRDRPLKTIIRWPQIGAARE